MKYVLIVFLIIIFLIMFIEPARNYINNFLLKRQDNLQTELKEKEITGYASGRSPIKSKGRIEKIQQALKNAGFYKGDIDGKIGLKTRSAVKAFQKSKGLIADGVVGQKTWNELSKYFKN